MTLHRAAPSGHGPIEVGPDGRPPATGRIELPDLRNLPPFGSEESTAGPEPAPSGSRVAKLARKASWNLADQVITAATNTLLFIVLARSVSKGRLDAFTNAFYIFTLMIGIGRALVGQVLSVRFSDSEGAPWRTALRQAFGFIVAITLAASAVIAGVGLLVDGPLHQSLLALAVVLPALIMQDACRNAFFAQSQAKQAALNDGLWAVIQFGAIAALIHFGHADVGYLVLAWGGGAAVCVLLALTQLRVVPDLRAAPAWIRRSWNLSRFFLAENLLTSGAFTGGFLIVGAMVGEGAVSAIRGAQVLVGPLETLSSAMFTFTLPELARRSWLSVRTRWKIATAASAAMLTVALAYTAVLWLMPDDVGRLIFRANWDGPSTVLLPIALGSAAARACLGPAVTIYAMGMARRTFKLMTVEAPLVLSLMLGGAAVGGVVGAAWGLAANQALLIPLWFLTLRSILRLPPEALAAESLLHDDHDTPDTAGTPGSPDTAALPVLDGSGRPIQPRHAAFGSLPLPPGAGPARGRHTRNR
ncbi:MAG: hypothetical protein IPJ14_08295 [Kineosporiaceae bacterium]|nr:hypothetical protein [Kineosporiaceae bacterium]MBK7622653.1 hypothetical protein [Kineosporiaceae bacterium]MBK8078632.1 hypothetical protein [Kineosporiaceae bacterium]